MITTEKLLRKDAAENRERILKAAMQVFAAEGPDASVDEIARIAGVGMGTLYRRFPTKDELIAELVSELLHEIQREAESALAPRDGLGLSRFLYATAKQQVKHRGCLSRLWLHHEPELRKNIKDLIAALVVDAQEHGEVRTDVDVHDIFVVLWSMKGIIDLSQSVAPNGWRRHLDIVIAGLRPSSEVLQHPPLTTRQFNSIRALHSKR
jgi:AcrR family transcriptional regulator